MKICSFLKLLLIFSTVFSTSCTLDRTRDNLLLAEQMVKKGNYDAAIRIYQQTAEKMPFSEYGQKALFNVAVVQEIYLKQPREAEKSYRLLLKRTKNKTMKSKAYEKLANLYFSVFREYDKSIEVYKMLLKLGLNVEKAGEYSFQIGRSFYLASSFQDAIQVFEEIKKRFSESEYASKAELEIANSYASMGDCKSAESHYQVVIKDKSKYLQNMATFGLASCYEEMDRLDDAYRLFSSIEKTYPNPSVVSLKLRKIKRRRILRRR